MVKALQCSTRNIININKKVNGDVTNLKLIKVPKIIVDGIISSTHLPEIPPITRVAITRYINISLKG